MQVCWDLCPWACTVRDMSSGGRLNQATFHHGDEHKHTANYTNSGTYANIPRRKERVDTIEGQGGAQKHRAGVLYGRMHEKGQQRHPT